MRIPDFSDLKIAVIGDIMLDEYYDCIVERISPEAPVMICKTDKSKSTETLGGAGNVALNCSRLGSEVYLFGILGNDKYCNTIHKICNTNKIFSFTEGHSNINTIRKVRYKKGHNQIIRIDYENSDFPYELDTHDLQNRLFKQFSAYIDSYNLVILSDYNKGTLNEKLCTDVIELCNDKNIPVYVDPKGNNWNKYFGATCLTPNIKEFAEEVSLNYKDLYLTDTKLLVDDTRMSILEQYDIESVLITKGKYGLSYIDDNETFHYQKDTQEVFDVSGAGDTVIAVFAMAMTRGFSYNDGFIYDYKDAVILADIAAKIVIRKSGTYAVSIEELTEEVNKYNLINGIVYCDGPLNHKEVEKIQKYIKNIKDECSPCLSNSEGRVV